MNSNQQSAFSVHFSVVSVPEGSSSLVDKENGSKANHDFLELLMMATNLKRAEVKDIVEKGAVWIARRALKKQDEKIASSKARRVRRIRTRLNQGDQISLYYNPSVLKEPCPEPKLIDMQTDFSVWDKPSGMLCQGSKWGDHTSLIRVVHKQLGDNYQPYIVHRLDKMASGLILIAHNKQAAVKFAALFENRNVYKEYLVLVKGHIDQPLPHIIDRPLDDKSAITELLFTEPATSLLNNESASHLEKTAFESISIVRLSIKTGRKHQIRRHLASMGHPVIGDRLYGEEIELADCAVDLQLRAILMRFEDKQYHLK